MMSPHEDRLSDFNRDSRILKISSFAAIIGVISATVAYGLLWLIRMMTNLA